MKSEQKDSTATYIWLPSLTQIEARQKPGFEMCDNKVIRGLIATSGGELTKWPQLDDAALEVALAVWLYFVILQIIDT